MLLRTEKAIPAADNPTPTAAKRLGRFLGGIDESKYRDKNHAPTITFPGVDLAALRREWGPQTAGMPRVQNATFRVPLGITPSAYEKLRNHAVTTWLNAMGKAGFELRPWPGRKQPIAVTPGIYPAIDLASGVPILDQREFICEAMFSYRKAKTMKIEIPGEVIQPLTVRA